MAEFNPGAVHGIKSLSLVQTSCCVACKVAVIEVFSRLLSKLFTRRLRIEFLVSITDTTPVFKRATSRGGGRKGWDLQAHELETYI